MSNQKVLAKFKCSRVVNFEFGKEAHLNAVVGNDGDNSDYSKNTPNGELKIAISADVPAADYFQPGKEYYITFSEEKPVENAAPVAALSDATAAESGAPAPEQKTDEDKATV